MVSETIPEGFRVEETHDHGHLYRVFGPRPTSSPRRREGLVATVSVVRWAGEWRVRPVIPAGHEHTPGETRAIAAALTMAAELAEGLDTCPRC